MKFASLIPVTWFEKSYGLIAIVLYVQGRISSQVLTLGLIDLPFATLFVCAYVTTGRNTGRVSVTDSTGGATAGATGRAGQR